MKQFQWLVLMLAALLLAACGGSDEGAGPPAGPTQPVSPVAAQAPVSAPTAPVSSRIQVLDTFNIGSGVYARSLAMEPASNAVWVGTSVGVMEIDLQTLNPRNIFTREHGLANEYVFAIFVDSRGYKWFGTNGGGMSRYKDGEWKTYFPMHGLADYWIYAFTEQADGGLWIGTWAGANHLEPNTDSFRTYFKELVNEWVYGLDVDSRQRVWFGTEGGVSMYDGQQWREWTHKEGLGAANENALPPSTNTGLGTRSRHDLNVLRGGSETYNPNYTFTILADNNDHIWAGTWGGGAGRFDGNSWKNYTMEDGLSGNIVYNILQDSKGALWFGTNHGISRYDGKQWQRFGPTQGVPDSHFYALAEAPDGSIWAGTLGSVIRLGERP